MGKNYSEINSELYKGERIEERIIPSPWEYLLHYMIGGFLVFFYGIGIIYILITEFIRRGNKYYITNKRVIHEFNFLSKKISGIVYKNVRDIHMTQNIIERVFKIGRVYMNTSGSNKIEITFKGIKHPVAIKNKIEKHIR